MVSRNSRNADFECAFHAREQYLRKDLSSEIRVFRVYGLILGFVGFTV